MTSSVNAPPPCDNKKGSTEMRPTLAPYSDGNILMGNIDDSVTMTYTNKVARELGSL